MHGLDLVVGGVDHLGLGEGEAGLVVAQVGDRGVERQVALEEEAVCLALLGDEGKAVVHSLLCVAEVHELVAEVDATGRTRTDAEDRLEQLRAAGADKSVEAEDLALAHVERDVGEVGGVLRREVLDGEDGIPGRVVHGREAVVERAADHSGDQLVHVRVLDALGHDQLAVAQDRDVVADLEDLVHLVGNVNQRDALLLEHAHHREELLDLLRHERGGGLVQNDDLGVVGDGLRDLAHLALRDRHVAHRRVEVDREAELAEEVGGLLAHAALIDDAESVRRVATEEQVVLDVAVEALVELLVHHRDAVLKGILGSGEGDLLAVEPDGPLILLIGAEQAVHHRRLACAVLTHETHDGAAPDVEVDVVQDSVASERLAHALDRQDDVVLLVSQYVSPLTSVVAPIGASRETPLTQSRQTHKEGGA